MSILHRKKVFPLDKLLLNINRSADIDRLQSMMYLDKGKYEFHLLPEGILIEFDDSRATSFRAFIRTFSLWFAREAFLHHGDRYFREHPHHELWEIWKQDMRFHQTYCDEFYQKWMEYRLEGFFRDFEEYYMVEVRMEDLFEEVAEFAKVRLDLVADHFADNRHPEYIERQIARREPKRVRMDGMKTVPRS